MYKRLLEWLRVLKLSTTLCKQFGYATVEFALTIPLVIMMAVMSVWMLGLTVTDLRLHSAAASAARILARGQALPSNFSQILPEQAQYEVIQEESIVRVSIHMNAKSPIPLIPIPVTVTASAVASREDLPIGP